MNTFVVGVLSFHICVVTGQLNFPYNQSTIPPVLLKRTSRSVLSFMTSSGEQRCHGCVEGSSMTGKCSRKKLSRVRSYTENLKCLPEAKLVELQAPDSYYSVMPAMARVNRCSGYCKHGFQTCLPTASSFVKIPVMLTNHRERGAPKCVEYEVEQHDSCECGCEIKEEECSTRHTHEKCSCKCDNEADKFHCLDKDMGNTRVWDERSCKCICEPEVCPMGYLWNTNSCRCVMMAPSDIENLLY